MNNQLCYANKAKLPDGAKVRIRSQGEILRCLRGKVVPIVRTVHERANGDDVPDRSGW